MNLTLADVQSLKIDLGTPQSLTRMFSGYSNHNYLLTTSLGKYRLRVPQYSSDLDKLLSEKRLLDWAAERCNLVVPLLHLFTLPNGIHASVFPFVEADPGFQLQNAKLMRDAGKALAAYHLAVERYEGALPWKTLSESFTFETVHTDALRRVVDESSLTEYPNFWTAVENLLSRMKHTGKQLDEQPYLSMPHLACHGDFAPANLLALQDEFVGIIDFECCRYAPRVHDVAVFLLALQQSEEYEESMSQWFLEGYQSRIVLMDTELEWIPILQRIRSLESAKRHFRQVIQGDHEVNAGLVMYWDRITAL